MPLTKNLNTKFWLVQVSALAFISLFVSLGVWQHGRGNIKADIETSLNNTNDYFDDVRLPIVDLESERYKNIKLYGEYDDSKQVLLDNQIIVSGSTARQSPHPDLESSVDDGSSGDNVDPTNEYIQGLQ